MITRRNLALGLAAGACGAALVPTSASALERRPEYVGGVRPTLIAGQPPHIDFGHGLMVPATNAIFSTLWEGDDRYLSFGRAVSVADVRASAKAELAAIGTMKFMMLTLAFAPQRLTRVESCGWRSASGSIRDLVLGDVNLPGRPYHPRVEGWNGMSADNLDVDATLTALCVYMVMKHDADLNFVRRNARLVCSRPPITNTGEPATDPAILAHEICPVSGQG